MSSAEAGSEDCFFFFQVFKTNKKWSPITYFHTCLFLSCTWIEKEEFIENVHLVLFCLTKKRSVSVFSVFLIFFSERWQSALFHTFHSIVICTKILFSGFCSPACYHFSRKSGPPHALLGRKQKNKKKTKTRLNIVQIADSRICTKRLCWSSLMHTIQFCWSICFCFFAAKAWKGFAGITVGLQLKRF